MLLFVLLSSRATPLQAQAATDSIRLNQIGFYPRGPKLAVITGAKKPGKFFVTTPDHRTPVFTGTLQLGKQLRTADFSAFQTPGTYVLSVPGTGFSYPFQIRARVHEAVASAALKSYYYQRASTELPARYAGRWSRAAGHPDTRVLVHPSAATTERPAQTVLAAPRGWYDAGDYNKYVVNSGVTLGTLLSLYEEFPAYCAARRTNIPESANDLPDLLDEALWNLRWLLAMQDPLDGGVYHKLTNPAFDAFVMPAAAQAPRYVVQKSTAATLDFAAVMAQASRIAGGFPRQLPGLADSCLRAATQAWQWAQMHPQDYYRQNEINTQTDPDIQTGEYSDDELRDERAWAAAELFITTRDAEYYKAFRPALDRALPLASWAQVQALAFYSLARFRAQLPAVARPDADLIRLRLLTLADTLIAGAAQRPYQTAMGRSTDFQWGSNGLAANQGVALLQAYRLSGKKAYLRSALTNLDYLLGRNATGYCFVTGYGTKSPRHPHHRPSEADGIAEPVPSFLVGGPNPGQQDGCKYPSARPEKSYTDLVCSYASNEVAINWSAPLVYLAFAIEAYQDALP
nr:glycoside hydrolase family 9 protein [Hymenobacter rubidus]